MKKITIIISILLLNNIFAQTVNREVNDFQLLKVSNALEVILTQGEENTITIEGALPEDLDKIKTELESGVLSLYTKGKIKSKDVKILVTFSQLQAIELSGASEISTTNIIKSDQFSIKGSGATESDLDLEVNQLSINFSGASDVKLVGTAETFDLTLSGASDLKASEFVAKNVRVDISGASDVKVHATESITGRASGASSINIKGKPSERNIQTSVASSSTFHNIENVSVNLGGSEIDDTTRMRWMNTDVLFMGDSIHINRYKKKRLNHWAGVDLGINGFLDANNSIDLSNPSYFEQTNPKEVTQFMELNYRKSWTVSINFMEFFIKLKEHHLGIVTGLGTEWNNYELKHNIRLNSEGGSHVYPVVDEFNKDYTWGEIDTNYNYSKNRFKTWFVNAPLLLELNTGNNKNKSFHIAAGAIVGLNLQTKIKYKYEEPDGSEKKEKDKQSFNTNPFRVILTTRVGVGRFNVFATYSLTPLFEDGRGPELYPFTVGITLLGF